MIGVIGVDKTFWLGDVDFFSKSPLKRCVVHIELLYGPVSCDSNVKDEADGG